MENWKKTLYFRLSFFGFVFLLFFSVGLVGMIDSGFSIGLMLMTIPFIMFSALLLLIRLGKITIAKKWLDFVSAELDS